VNGRRAVARAAALIAAAGLLLPFGAAAPAQAKIAKSVADDLVVIHVDSVSPSTPIPTTHKRRLSIALTVTNRTPDDIQNLEILGERGDPIGGQAALDQSLANPVPPASGLPIPSRSPIQLALPAGASTSVTFETTTSTVDSGTGICMCASPITGPLIYPLFFTAHQLQNGVDNILGVTTTYLPIFYQTPQPVRVSWVWPLLDVPHRLANDTVFTDDTLAESISTGRLSNALAVVEQVGGQVPITLLVDPDLLDEIEVMATGQYTVLSADGKTTPGTGQAAATAWLARFRAVLQNDPGVTVELTPYADPDVETVTARGLTWADSMPAEMIGHVTDALAGRPFDTSVSWPVTGAISRTTLRRLAPSVKTVLLNSSAVTFDNGVGHVLPGFARLSLSATTQLPAALLSPDIEKYAARAISLGAGGVGSIPPLVAELAVRAVEQPDAEHAVAITAPRYVDPDVTAAVRTILETSTSTFAQPISLLDVLRNSTGTLISTTHSALAKVPGTVLATAPATLQAAGEASVDLRAIRSLLDTQQDQNAAALVASLPESIQRAESSAWRNPANLAAGEKYATALSEQFNDLKTGVQIGGGRSYTLASSNSPLPITISNALRFGVRVRVRVIPRNTSGLTAQDVGVESIDAGQTKTIYVPTTTVRSGRFLVDVLLQTPNRQPLGPPVTMAVRSTALGPIGVIITIVSGAVLAIALLWRVVRRLRSRRARGAPPEASLPVGTPEPVA
jgi:Family of unknown function (DUF6049)